MNHTFDKSYPFSFLALFFLTRRCLASLFMEADQLLLTDKQGNKTNLCMWQYTLYNLEQIVLIGFQILMTQRSAPINCRNHYTEGTVSYRVNCVFLFPYCGVRHKKDTFSSMPRCLIFPFCFIVVSFESQTVHQGYIFVLIVGTQSTCACFS